MHRDEYIDIRIVAVRLFEETYKSHASDDEKDQLFYILCKKFINHINSFHALLNGTNFEDIIAGSQQIDHSSAKVILRAAFETYLTLYHLFFDKSELTDFRISLYKHSGLTTRQNKLPHRNLTAELEDKVAKEKATIEKLEREIHGKAKELKVDHKLVAKTLKDGWRAGNGWPQIGERSPLDNKYVDSVYPYLCGYSHSGYESYMQLVSDKRLSLSDVHEMQRTLYFYATYLLAKFCKLYLSSTKDKVVSIETEISDIDLFLNKYRGVYS